MGLFVDSFIWLAASLWKMAWFAALAVKEILTPVDSEIRHEEYIHWQ